MPNNSASYAGKGVPLSIVSVEEDLAAFDRLPPFLRDRLNYAPHKGGATTLLQLYEERHAAGEPDWWIAHQVDQAIAYIADMMRQVDEAERAGMRLFLNGTKRQALRRRVDPKRALQRAEDRQRRAQAAAQLEAGHGPVVRG